MIFFYSLSTQSHVQFFLATNFIMKPISYDLHSINLCQQFQDNVYNIYGSSFFLFLFFAFIVLAIKVYVLSLN